MLGLSLSTCPRVPEYDPVDPVDEDNTALWQASYAGVPWAGTPSEGPSGSYSLTSTSAPSVGTELVNGYAPAVFDGVSNILNGPNIPLLVSPSGYLFFALVKISSIPTNAVGSINNVALARSTMSVPRFMITLRDNGGDPLVYFVHRDDVTTGGADAYKVATARIKLHEPQLILAGFSGSSIGLGVNRPPSNQVVAAPLVEAVTDTLRYGSHRQSTSFLPFEMLATGFRNTAQTYGQCMGLIEDTRQRYEVALT